MIGQMAYEVNLTEVESRRTAVVAGTTTWQDFPALWGQLLGEVWDCLRAGGISGGCRNIMLYRDSVPNVEVGVLLSQPCPLTGRVVASGAAGVKWPVRSSSEMATSGHENVLIGHCLQRRPGDRSAR